MAKTSYKSVDDYLAAQDDDARAILERARGDPLGGARRGEDHQAGVHGRRAEAPEGRGAVRG